MCLRNMKKSAYNKEVETAYYFLGPVKWGSTMCVATGEQNNYDCHFWNALFSLLTVIKI